MDGWIDITTTSWWLTASKMMIKTHSVVSLNSTTEISQTIIGGTLQCPSIQFVLYPSVSDSSESVQSNYFEVPILLAQLNYFKVPIAAAAHSSITSPRAWLDVHTDVLTFQESNRKNASNTDS
eukprot:20191-Amphidinium_carterae.1